jgi:hypothetical protein
LVGVVSLKILQKRLHRGAQLPGQPHSVIVWARVDRLPHGDADRPVPGEVPGMPLGQDPLTTPQGDGQQR